MLVPGIIVGLEFCLFEGILELKEEVAYVGNCKDVCYVRRLRENRRVDEIKDVLK